MRGYKIYERKRTDFTPGVGSGSQSFSGVDNDLYAQGGFGFVRAEDFYNYLADSSDDRGSLLAVASINNAVAHNMLEEYSQTYLYRHQIRLWEQKVIRMDYELFTSPQGKLLAEKARNVVSSPNWGVVAYLPRLTLLLENAAGLLTFGAIIGGLNPWIFVFLLALFGMEMILTVKTEKKKHTLQSKQAVVNRKLNYLAYGTRGMQEGRIFVFMV